MVAAYLLNDSSITALLNSVSGADPLNSFGSGMSYDSGTESLAFTGAGFLQLPSAVRTACDGIAALTIVIGYKSPSTPVPLWYMGDALGIGQGDYVPYSDGNIYTAALLPARHSFAPPGGIVFSDFNHLAVTGAGGGSVLLYFNGTLANTQAADATVGLGTSGHLGHNTDGGQLTGNIAYFYVWTRVLSPTELATLAADPYTPIFSASLTAQTITFGALGDKLTTDAPFNLTASSDSGLTVSFSVTSGPATISGNTVTLTGAAGTVTIQATQAGNGTYAAATPVSHSFDVTLAPQTITFPTISAKLTTDAPFNLAATSDSGLTVSYAVTSGPATVSGNTVTLTGAGTVTIEATQAGNGTYAAATPADRGFDVTAPDLTAQTITFPSIADHSMGDAPFGLTASSSSSLTVSYTVTSGPATVSGSTVTLTGGGSVTIEATQAGNGTYAAATPVSRTFAVSLLAQTITFPSIPNHSSIDAPFAFTPATSTSGLTVSYTLISGPATLSGTTVTITGPGVVTIQATQAGNGSYAAAPPVSRSFGISSPATSGITLLIDEPFIGLIDRTGYLFNGGSPLGTSASRGSRATITPEFQVKAGDSYTVPEGAPIFLYENVDGIPTCTFAGTINDTQIDWEGPLGYHTVKINCTSLEQCFDTIEVEEPVAYFNKTRGFIVRDLFTRFCGGVPVTLGTISGGGTVPSAVYAARERIWDIFTTLASDAGFVLYVKPANQTLQFCLQSTEAAPFALHSRDIIWESLSLKNTRSDYRNRQTVQVSFAAFSASNKVFQGDGFTTQFFLSWPVDQVLTAMLTPSTQATGIGTFVNTGGSPPDYQPEPGDTITITPNPGLVEDPYTFVDALDNRIRNQVLIGATISATCQNLVDAINAEPSKAGRTFSLPTWENDCANAVRISAHSFHLVIKNPGSGGNGITLAATGSHFTWSDFASPPGASTAGGTDGPIIVLNVGNATAGTLSNDVTYTRGSNLITTLIPVALGTNLSVSYNRLGADCISVEDTAQVALRATLEHGSGKYQQLLTDSSNTDARSGYLKALQALAANSEIAIVFAFQTDRPLLSPGQHLDVTLQENPVGTPAILNGDYIVQQVDGTLIGGKEKLPEPYCHLRYTVTVVNVPGVPTTVQLWENLVIIPHPQSTPVASNSDTSSATPTVADIPADNPADPGADPIVVPTAAAPLTAGGSWVQEAPGRWAEAKGDDLTVGDADDTAVTAPLSHIFVIGDVGKKIIVIAGDGWTLAEFAITAVVAGVATLSSSPALAGTPDGIFSMVSDDIYALSYIPAASTYTGRQIVILSLNGAVLSPFSPGAIGYSGSGTGAPDYSLSGNRITFAIPPGPDDVLLAEYFPAGVAGPADGGGAAGSKTGVTITLAPLGDTTPHIGGGSADVDLLLGGSQDFFVTITVYGSPDAAVIWALNPLSSMLQAGIGTLTASPAGPSVRTYHAPTVMPSDGQAVKVRVTSHLDKHKFAEGLVFLIAPTPPPGSALYVAVSTSVMTSEDAITWTERSAPLQAWRSVAYGNGAWVAVDFLNRTAMRSTDGITWTTSLAPLEFSEYAIASMIFDGTQFVWVLMSSSEEGIIGTSLDGITWSFTTVADVSGLWGVAFGAGVRVVTAQTELPSRTWEILDGSWVDPTVSSASPPGLVSFPICFGGGLFVGISTLRPLNGTSPDFLLHSLAITSADGTTWTEHSISAREWQAICYGAGLYVAVGWGGAVATSPDGETWTDRTAANLSDWQDVIYAGGQFVAVGNGSDGDVVMTSPNGFDWTERTAPPNSYSGIAYH